MDTDNTSDIMDTQNVSEVQEEATNPTSSPDPEAVKAYLAAKEAQEQAAAQETAESLLNDGETPSEAQEEPQEEEAPKEPQEERIRLKYSSDFVNNEADAMERQSITINLKDIPITHDDEVAYLKSMLNDSPFELDIELYGGQMHIHARAISVYEQQLAALAAFNETARSDNPSVAAILAPTYLQKVRIALQLRSCNGLPVSDLAYKPEPGKINEHAADLAKKADELLGNSSAARWNAYIYALNIFEHKLTKLNEMALNRDFLSPGD